MHCLVSTSQSLKSLASPPVPKTFSLFLLKAIASSDPLSSRFKEKKSFFLFFHMFITPSRFASTIDLLTQQIPKKLHCYESLLQILNVYIPDPVTNQESYIDWRNKRSIGIDEIPLKAVENEIVESNNKHGHFDKRISISSKGSKGDSRI